VAPSVIISSGAISDHQQWRTISVVVETGCICRVSIRSTPSAVTNGTQIKRPYNSYSLVGAKVRVNESQWPSEASRRPPEGNQTQSDAIRRHRRAIRRNQTQSDAIGGQSDAIRRNQTPSEGNQTQSDAIRRHQTPSDAIRRHRRAIRRNQTQSEAIGGLHRSSGRCKLTRRPMLPHSQVRLGAR
jgi:hypothetical protein